MSITPDSFSAGAPARLLGDRAAILATVLLWGVQIPVLHWLGQRWDPFTLNLVRYVIAAAGFGLLSLCWSLRAPTSLTMGRTVALGALMSFFGILFTTGAMVGNPVATATVSAMMPLTASLVTWAVVGVRPARRTVMALAVVMPGAALATPTGGGDGGGHPALGMALMLCAQATWALYSLCALRWTPDWPVAARVALSIRASLPFHAAAFLAALVVGVAPARLPVVSASDAMSIVAVTLGPLMLGVILWSVSVARLGLPLSALHLNLAPLVGIAAAAALGVWPGVLQLVGAALVVGAMVIIRPDAATGRK